MFFLPQREGYTIIDLQFEANLQEALCRKAQYVKMKELCRSKVKPHHFSPFKRVVRNLEEISLESSP